MAYTEIAATDQVSDSREDINENFRTSSHKNDFSVTAGDSPLTPGVDDSGGSPVDVYLCDTSSGNITFDLGPVASGDQATGRPYTFVKTTNDSNKVILDPDGSETINGATTAELLSQYDAVTIYPTSGGWVLI